jgi:hypothetical protein
MITLKTKVAKPIFDLRYKQIGEYEIYLTIEKLEENINQVTASGFYFYKKPNEVIEGEEPTFSDVILDSFATKYTWEQIAQVETMLQPLVSSTSYYAVTNQRMKEFALFQQQLESGNNFGILYSEWDV